MAGVERGPVGGEHRRVRGHSRQWRAHREKLSPQSVRRFVKPRKKETLSKPLALHGQVGSRVRRRSQGGRDGKEAGPHSY